MVVLGLILVGIAVLLTAGVAASSGETATLEVFGVGVDTRSSVLFFTGVVTTLALLLGLWMEKKGLARGYRRRKEVRDLRQKVQETPPAPVAALAETDAEGNDHATGKHLATTGDDATADDGDRDSGDDRDPGDEEDHRATPAELAAASAAEDRAASHESAVDARAEVPPADRPGR